MGRPWRLVIAALICHFLFYLVPGRLGQKTGLPLYVVGTSTYGVTGGLFMPGFLMGLLQFGWLAVNANGVAEILCGCLIWKPQLDIAEAPSLYHARDRHCLRRDLRLCRPEGHSDTWPRWRPICR